MKRCTKCKIEKPLSEYHKHPASRDGLRPICKTCVKAYQAEWKANPKVAAHRKAYEQQRQQTDQRKEQQRLYQRKSYYSEAAIAKRQQETEQNRRARQEARARQLADPEYQAEQRRKRKAIKSSEKALAQRRKRRADRYQNEPGYRDQVLRKQRERTPRYDHLLKKARQKHTDRYNTDLEYRKAYNAKVNAQVHKRRSKMNGGGSHTAMEWEALCEKYDHRCLCCGERKPLTKDHIIPVMPNDPTIPSGSDDISNIQPLCIDCNLRKGNRHCTDYRPAEEDT